MQAHAMLNDDVNLGRAIELAEDKMRERSYIEAIACWQQIMAASETFPIGVRVRLAAAYLEAGYADKAEAEINYCLQLAPYFDKALELRDRINAKKRLTHEVVLTQAKEVAIRAHIESKLRPIPYEAIAAFPLKGWVAVREGESASLLLEITNKSVTRLAFNEIRDDVADVLARSGAGNFSPVCGFNYVINVTDISKIGVEINGQASWVYQARTEEMLQVLRGKDNWLFLENDANKSVDQYTGKTLLDAEALLAYEDFVHRLKQLQRTQPLCFLVSPNKESVFPEHYPFPRGEKTILNQVMAVAGLGEENYFMYPASVLSKAQNAYCRTDTHWTHAGAYTVFLKCLDFLDRPINHCRLFNFKTKLFEGDLGSKLERVEYDTYTVSTPVEDSAKIVFKSGTPRNHGRVCIYENDQAAVKGTMAIFGSSFSYYYLEMFAAVFRRVFFMYSPASPVLEVLEAEKPDFVVLETPERFLVNPPRIIEKLSGSPLNEILDSLTPFEKDQVRGSLENEIDSANIVCRFMKEKLLEAVAA